VFLGVAAAVFVARLTTVAFSPDCQLFCSVNGHFCAFVTWPCQVESKPKPSKSKASGDKKPKAAGEKKAKSAKKAAAPKKPAGALDKLLRVGWLQCLPVSTLFPPSVSRLPANVLHRTKSTISFCILKPAVFGQEGGGSSAYPLKQLMIGVFDCPPLLLTGVKKVKAAAKPKTKKAAPVKA
jgi:hypothetical protein